MSAPPAATTACATSLPGETPPPGQGTAPAPSQPHSRPRHRSRTDRAPAAVPTPAVEAMSQRATTTSHPPSRAPRYKPPSKRGATRRAKKPTDPDMRRLFVALTLPDAVRAKLDALPLHPLQHQLNLAAAATLHVTLHFLDLAPLSRVSRALERVRARPFRIAVRGMGAFPLPDAARVLWAGVQEVGPDTGRQDGADGDACAHGGTAAIGAGGEALTHLFNEVGKAVRNTGVKTDDRAYHPHVTVAKQRGSGRRKRSTPEIADFVADNGELDAGEFDVTEFVLYESVLQDGGGSVYQVLRRYALREEGADASEDAGDGPVVGVGHLE